MPDTRADGRTARTVATRAKIIAACRALMLAGDFRPSAIAIAQRSGVAVRTVFQHFTDIQGVHRASMDVETRDAIAKLIMPADRLPPPLDADCIAFAAVFGRPIPPKGAPPVATAEPAATIAAE